MRAELKKIIVFLGESKKYVGFSDWDISLVDSKDKNNKSNFIARVYPDIDEKELEIEIFKDFFELSEEKQKNVLFHELIHGRMSVYNQEARLHTLILEENMINDITRGFERYREFEWQDDKEYVFKKKKGKNK